MSEFDAPEGPDDPWLTVAEIADELRVNPATVRLWVSKGTLPAKRAGKRKLLIRRSDLDCMLEVTRGEAPAPRYQPRPRDPRYPGRMGPPTSVRQLSTADIHGHRAAPDQMQQIIEELQLADETWEGASGQRERTTRSRVPPPSTRRRRSMRAPDGVAQQGGPDRRVRLDSPPWPSPHDPLPRDAPRR